MLKLGFKTITACNMCNAPGPAFRVMGLRLNTSQGFKPSAKTGVATTICRCTNCGLIFANPQPLPNSFDDQYGISADEYWHTGLTPWMPTYFKSEIEILKSLQFNINGAKALDIGAGYGKCMLSLNHAGMDAYGFEPAKEFYKTALNEYKILPGKLRLATIEDVDYEPESFDFITFGAVLEHIHDPNAALNKAIKWLKPGGLIHIEVPSANWLIAKLYNSYYKFFCFSNYVTNLSPMHSPFHHYEFSNKSFIENGNINGYKIAYSKVEVCLTMLPFSLLDKPLQKLMQITGTGLQRIVFLQKNL